MTLPPMKPLLFLVALLALSGCDDGSPRLTPLMERRLPDTSSVLIVTDEAGQRYVIKRKDDDWYAFQVMPYNPPKPATP